MNGYWATTFVPEYFPPPRTEAWLTLPPGAVIRRDLERSGALEEPYEYERRWLGPTPPENRATTKRFIAEFGEEAAYQWKFPGVPGMIGRVMRDAFSEARLDQQLAVNRQFYAGNPFEGRIAKIPLKKS